MEKLLSLANRLEAMNNERKALQAELEEEARKLGLGFMFQDPNTGAVYKIVRPEGRFVTFPEIGYVRTRIKALGEKQGGLSLSAAKEAGYDVE